MDKPKRLFLIDGMAQIYRSHFAMSKNPLITKDGRHTSAIFGFMNSLFKLIREENPDYLAVTLDSRETTFRHKIFTDYKATREKMPDELIEQLEPLFEVIQATRIPMFRKPGFEADDIMGTIAKKAESNGLQTYLVTSDKDMMQVVNDSIFVYSPGNRFKPTKIYDLPEVEKKFAVSPQKIIEYLVLVGDSSDNIPGIDGVGAVTAAKLLNQYQSIESILDHVDEVKNKRARNGLINGKNIIPLTIELVTINLDVPLELHIDDLKRQPMDFPLLKEKMEELELFSLISPAETISGWESDSKSDEPKFYDTILDREKLGEMKAKLLLANVISFDIESTSIDALQAEIVGMSFSIEAHHGWYIPIRYPNCQTDMFSTFNLENILDELRPIFEDENVKICGQNIKYDALVLSRYGVKLNGINFDTIIAAHLLNPDSNSYKLDNLSQEYLHYHMVPIKDLIGSGKKQKCMSQIPLEDISFYAVEDADIALQLTQLFRDKLESKGLERPFYEIEIPLLPVLIQMEKNGVYVDQEFLKKLSGTLSIQLDDLTEKIHSMAGSEFNINSPKQLAVVLFDELGLKPFRKRSTDVAVLERLKNHHPLPELVLNYRHLKKLISTYIDAFPDFVNPATERIHTSLNQTIAATGRLSSNRPNFQNIPIRTELGRDIRKAFCAQKSDWVIFSADYSQVELRIMAHYSQEPTLLQAFHDGVDIHRRTAGLVNGISQEEVTEEMRRSAKVVNFGIMYGAGPYRMAQELGISMKQAQELIDTYFNTYPGIRNYIDETITKAREDGYVETLLGRRRKTPGLGSSRTQQVQAEERMAINMPIQGTAAELIKIAMIRIHQKMEEKKLQSKMILQIHDELLFEVPQSELESLIKLVVFEMENAIKLDVPLKVDYGVGDNWFEAH